MPCGVIPIVLRATEIITMFSGGGFQATRITKPTIKKWSPTVVLYDLGDD